MVFHEVVNWARQVANSRIHARVAAQLRSSLFAAIARSRWPFFCRQRAGNLSKILTQDVERAVEWFEEALGVWREINYPAGIVLARFSLGRLYAESGNVGHAAENLDEAIERGRDLNASPIISASHASNA